MVWYNIAFLPLLFNPRNLWLLDLLNYAVKCDIKFFLGSVETCIVSDIEIDRNQRSEELLKLGGGQEIIFS